MSRNRIEAHFEDRRFNHLMVSPVIAISSVDSSKEATFGAGPSLIKMCTQKRTASTLSRPLISILVFATSSKDLFLAGIGIIHFGDWRCVLRASKRDQSIRQRFVIKLSVLKGLIGRHDYWQVRCQSRREKQHGHNRCIIGLHQAERELNNVLLFKRLLANFQLIYQERWP